MFDNNYIRKDSLIQYDINGEENNVRDSVLFVIGISE